MATVPWRAGFSVGDPRKGVSRDILPLTPFTPSIYLDGCIPEQNPTFQLDNKKEIIKSLNGSYF